MSMRPTTDYISYTYAAVVAFGGVFGYLKAGWILGIYDHNDLNDLTNLDY